MHRGYRSRYSTGQNSAVSSERPATVSLGPQSLFENYNANASFSTVYSNPRVGMNSSFRNSGINTVRSSGFPGARHSFDSATSATGRSVGRRPHSATLKVNNQYQVPKLNYGITLQDLNKDYLGRDTRVERDYGSFSSRRYKASTSDWTQVAGPASSDNDRTNVASTAKGSKKVWQWRGRTITFGGSSRKNATASKFNEGPAMPGAPRVTPRGRWGGKVGSVKPENQNQEAQDEGREETKNDDALDKILSSGPDQAVAPPSASDPKPIETAKHAIKTASSSRPLDEAKAQKKAPHTEKMIFVLNPDSAVAPGPPAKAERPSGGGQSTKATNAKKNKRQIAREKDANAVANLPSSPAPAPASSPKASAGSNLNSSMAIGRKEKKKKKKRARVSFTVNSPDVKIFEPVKEEDRTKLWHSHEDSIRNRMQLKLEKHENKTKVRKEKEENAKTQLVAKEKETEDIIIEKKKKRERKAAAKEKRRLERERVKKEREKELLRRRIEQAEKRELRKVQKRAAKAETLIEKNLKKKLGLHVDEVSGDENDSSLHNRIADLERELSSLKQSAVKKAKKEFKAKEYLRRNKTAVGNGKVHWRRGQSVNVVEFHKDIQLPDDLRGSLTLKDMKEMKKHTYSFE